MNCFKPSANDRLYQNEDDELEEIDRKEYGSSTDKSSKRKQQKGGSSYEQLPSKKRKR